jgi:two-component system cell cycle response regulator
MLETRLATEYYEVKAISVGCDALAIAHDWQPDVILLDIMMPGMDGYEICRMLKSGRSTAHIPVILITGLQNSPDRWRGLSSGADDFMSKPIEYGVLLARLRGIIRFKRLMDQWRARDDTAAALGFRADRPDDHSIAQARVLVIDNLASRAARINDILTAEGLIVTHVEAERDAAETVDDDGFDLILISLSLLDSDPLRLVARLRASKLTQDTPLLLLAEPEERDVLISALDLGATDCLMLPLDENELLLRATNHIRRKRHHDRLRIDVGSALHMAVIDPLTQLYNRRYVRSYLDRLCNDPVGGGFALLMLDVDRFKAINDQFGHTVGDHVLQGVAATLRTHLRQSDLLARFGGEEFIVIIGALSDPDVAMTVAEKLRTAIEAMVVAPGVKVTASIGVAIATAPAVAASLIDQADAALYHAKRAGRNQVTLHGPLLDPAASAQG